jgi:hypothetical protein
MSKRLSLRLTYRDEIGAARPDMTIWLVHPRLPVETALRDSTDEFQRLSRHVNLTTAIIHLFLATRH